MKTIVAIAGPALRLVRRRALETIGKMVTSGYVIQEIEKDLIFTISRAEE